MANCIFDLILLGIIVLHLIYYGFKGFLMSLWGLGSALAAAFLAYLFGPVCSSFLYESFFKEKVGDGKVSKLVSDISAYLLIFIAVSIILAIVGFFLAKIKNKLELKRLDSVLGALVGMIIGFIVVFAVCLAVSIIIELNLSGFLGEKISALKDIAEKSYIFRFLCQISWFDFVHITKLISDGFDAVKDAIPAAVTTAQ